MLQAGRLLLLRLLAWKRVFSLTTSHQTLQYVLVLGHAAEARAMFGPLVGASEAALEVVDKCASASTCSAICVLLWSRPTVFSCAALYVCCTHACTHARQCAAASG